MFRKLRDWMREQRRWSTDHRETWGPVTVRDAEGFTAFQLGTEARVREVLHRRGLELVDRAVVGAHGSEFFITAKVPDLNAEIWMYADQTDVSSPHGDLRLEHWDTRTPDEHYSKVVAFLDSLPITRDAS